MEGSTVGCDGSVSNRRICCGRANLNWLWLPSLLLLQWNHQRLAGCSRSSNQWKDGMGKGEMEAAAASGVRGRRRGELKRGALIGHPTVVTRSFPGRIFIYSTNHPPQSVRIGTSLATIFSVDTSR